MPIEILELICSKKPFKRFHIKLREGEQIKKFDFGLKDGETFIDHADPAKRDAYLKRHCGNKKEHQLITYLIPSPSLFSAKLLWGNSPDLFENLVELQTEFNKKAK